jgi:hypothetical protein
VHDPVNGDSPTVITQRIRDILAIWTEDDELTIVNSTATAENYIGNGDPVLCRSPGTGTNDYFLPLAPQASAVLVGGKQGTPACPNKWWRRFARFTANGSVLG